VDSIIKGLPGWAEQNVERTDRPRGLLPGVYLVDFIQLCRYANRPSCCDITRPSPVVCWTVVVQTPPRHSRLKSPWPS
jgi:hypothetical protein